MSKFKLYEEFQSAQAKSVYKKLLQHYDTKQLRDRPYGLAITKNSSDTDLRAVYYKECKKDPSKVEPSLLDYLTYECVIRNDLEFFATLSNKYNFSEELQLQLLRTTAKTDNEKFFEYVFQHMNDSVKKIALRKYCPIVPLDSFRNVNKIDEWIWNKLFDMGKISPEEGFEWGWFDIAFVPTHSIEKFGVNASISHDFVENLCKQTRLRDFQERLDLFLGLPQFVEYLKEHPNKLDVQVQRFAGGTTFESFLPQKLREEINHKRRGNLSTKKFGI